MRIARARHAANAETAEDPDDSPLTPRGMAAPPVQHATRRFDGDPSRPATIRIEANHRPQIVRRLEQERRPARLHPPVRTEPATLGQAIKGLLRSRALVLHAFLVLVVLGWIALFPATRAAQEVPATPAASAARPAAGATGTRTTER